jgi:hypothetical protein
MRRVVAFWGLTAVVVLAVTGASADQIWIENWDNGGGNWVPGTPFCDPHATTDGALWIDTGSGPVWLAAAVNMEVRANLATGWETVCLSLLPSPSVDTATYAGYFMGPAPSVGGFEAAPNPMDFQILAWSGDFGSYDAARAGGAYVADSGIFSNPINPGIMPLMYGFTKMPAMILKTVLAGDANMDGTVNITDLSKVLTNYDRSGMTWGDGDFNNDQTVNISDLSNVLTNYDKTAGLSGGRLSAVPEPGTLAILAAGLLGLVAYGWRKWR